MNIKKFLIILSLVLGVWKCTLTIQAQDAHFSQYYAAGLYLNPALVGAEEDITFKSNYRSQWRVLHLPYTTSQISVIYPLMKGEEAAQKSLGGVGVSFYNDKAGDGNFKTIGVMLSAAYTLHIHGTHNLLVFGAQGGYIQKQLDFTNLEWGSQFNPYLGFDATLNPNEYNIVPTTTNADVSAGMIWYHNNNRNYAVKTWSGYAGFAVSHLTRPDESIVTTNISRLPMLMKLHGGIEVHIEEHFNISPNFIAMYQNQNMQINLGGYINYRLTQRTNSNLTNFAKLIAGTWYRVDDSFIFMAGLENEHYTIGFSYDMNSSQLIDATNGNGAYEVSLAIRRVKEKQRIKFSTPRI